MTAPTTTSILETARLAYRVGLCVVPVREDGSKAPDTDWKSYQSERPSGEDMKRWFVERERSGLGYVCGKVSGGLEMLEFEASSTIVAFKMRARELDLLELVQRIETGYAEETPGGGVHWVYRVTDGEVMPNTKLASMPCPGAPECDKHVAGKAHVLIETRGEGGYFVAAPSHGAVHETGRAYVQRGQGLEHIAELTVEERDQLFALAASFDVLPRPVAGPRPVLTSDRSGTRPGDDFNARTPWADILEPAGWVWVHRYGHLDYWRRPGKTRGWSATTGPRGGDPSADYLYVFSTSTEFDAERGYSKFAAHTLLNYGFDDADFARAARELRSRGYGGDDYDGLDGVIAAGGATPSSVAAAGLAEEQPEASPAAITTPEPEPYAFKQVFSDEHFVSRYVRWASQLVDAAWEYHEAVALLLLAAATPSTRAYLTAHPRGLKTNLYMLIVGDSSSSRKSTAVDYGAALLDDFMPDTIIADRASPEGFIQDIAYRNGRSSVWLPDEFGDHYTRIKRRDPDLIEVLLTIYGGKDYSKRRAKKRVQGGEVVQDVDQITNPHFSILGGTTPAFFSQLTQNDVTTGMMIRFGIVMPTGKPERMPIRRLAERDDSERKGIKEYLDTLRVWSERYGAAELGSIEAVFTDDALEVLDAFEVDIEQQSEDILKRLPVMAYKLAMLAVVGEDVPRGARFEVGRQHALYAVEVVKKWRRYALAFQDSIGGLSEREQKFKLLGVKALRYLRDHGGRVSRAQMAKYLDLPARDVTDLQDTLVDRGDVLLVRGDSSDKGGRPPLFWAVPEAVEVSA